jgi:alpha-tubulin suppressor-like RCC1 family protein
VGDLHACARLENGVVYCWGYNFNHQVSQEDIESSPVPLEIVGLPLAYSLAVGGAHSCAIIKKPETFPPYGNVMCWGANGVQQVGSAVSPGFGEPSSHIRAVMLAAGNAHNCATDNFGILSCWGANGNGELGLGNKASPSSGSPSGLFQPPVVQIALGDSHSCVLHQDGVAQCWGLHNHGQLGCGTNFSPTTPAAVQLSIP